MTPPSAAEGPADQYRRPSEEATVVVVTDHWESRSETGWITRQVAGALATVADVHIVTPGGPPVGTTADSVFTVHGVDSLDGPASVVRDTTGASRPHVDCVVVAGTLWADAAHLAQMTELTGRFDIDGTTRFVVLPLAVRTDTALGHRSERPRALLVVTPAGSVPLAGSGTSMDLIHVIGAPLSAHPSALSEPDPLVGGTEYVVVHTGVREHDEHPAAELGRLLRLRFPDRVVALLHADAFCVWQGGRVKRTDAVERSSDVARLMAWARATVDLRPGALFARRCVESLLYGTPIVVPVDSRGQEHAERGRAGLWFANASELAWCVEAMFDPPVRDMFGAQGRAYAEAEFGSTDRFIERVLGACGLDPSPVPPLT